MAGRLCLLGFSPNPLSIVFNTLHALRSERELVIVENVHSDDSTPYDCGLPHRKLWYSDYAHRVEDEYFFGVGAPGVKQQVLEFFIGNCSVSRERFANLLHPSAMWSAVHGLDRGILVDQGCVVSPYARLGFGVTLLRGASIGHHAVVGDFTLISPRVAVGGHSVIGPGATIGIGAVVFDHISIGAGAFIGGGSVVNKDIPAGVVAYGNPCRVVRPRNAQD